MGASVNGQRVSPSDRLFVIVHLPPVIFIGYRTVLDRVALCHHFVPGHSMERYTSYFQHFVKTKHKHCIVT